MIETHTLPLRGMHRIDSTAAGSAFKRGGCDDRARYMHMAAWEGSSLPTPDACTRVSWRTLCLVIRCADP